METDARVLRKAVFASVPIEKITIVRVQGPLSIYAGIRGALFPATATGLVKVETDQTAVVCGLGGVQTTAAATAVAATSALAATATLGLELAAVVAAPFLLLEMRAVVGARCAQESQLREAGPDNPDPLGFGLLKSGWRLSADSPSAIFFYQLVEEPVNNHFQLVKQKCANWTTNKKCAYSFFAAVTS